MAKKPTLTTVASGYQSTTMLNANLNAINNALDNTLSRDGSTPNNMTADIDLNSNDLLNVATTHTTNLYLGGSRVVAEGTLNTVSNMDVDEFTGDGSTVAYVLSSTPLTVDVVIVNVDGVAQLATSYTLSVATLTFSEAPPLNSAIQIRYFTDIQLGSTTSADLVSYSQGGTGHVTRTVEARLRDHVSVMDFGAVGDGVTDDVAAIQAMASAEGYVRFPPGSFACSTTTVTVPIIFEPGANLLVASGQTFTMKNRVESSRQWIFRGNGDYFLVHDDALGIGEDSKQVHVSWFGAFPSPLDPTDQAPFIQKAIDAMQNVREGVVQFDNGNYHISSAMTVNRGVLIKGVGTRRTVFRADADGYDMFTTAGDGCRFTDIQFEFQSPALATFDGDYIVLNHNDCEVSDVRCFGPRVGVKVNADNCRISSIAGTYGATPSANSALVQLASGSGHLVEDVYALTSSFGPSEGLVWVGGTGALSNFIVRGVQHILPSRSVFLDASAGNIRRGIVTDIVYNGFAGTPPAYQIDLVTTGSYVLSEVSVNNFEISGLATNGIRVLQGSSGTSENITVGSGNIAGATGIGLRLERTAGTLQSVRVEGGFQALSRATPISEVGAMSAVRIAAHAQGNALAPLTYTNSLATDTAVTIDLHRHLFLASAIVAFQGSSSAQSALIQLRAATTPSIAAITALPSDIELLPSALTGTTGNAGKVTVGVQPNGLIYIENRTAATRTVAFTLFPTV
jgi:hypothetical protein